MPEYAAMHKAMGGLCNWISNGELSSILFGNTSLHDLMIVQTSEVSPHQGAPYLRISPLFKTRLIEFRFIDSNFEDEQWNRIEAPRVDFLVKRLIGFTKQLSWINDTIELIVPTKSP